MVKEFGEWLIKLSCVNMIFTLGSLTAFSTLMDIENSKRMIWYEVFPRFIWSWNFYWGKKNL